MYKSGGSLFQKVVPVIPDKVPRKVTTIYIGRHISDDRCGVLRANLTAINSILQITEGDRETKGRGESERRWRKGGSEAEREKERGSETERDREVRKERANTTAKWEREKTEFTTTGQWQLAQSCNPPIENPWRS